MATFLLAGASRVRLWLLFAFTEVRKRGTRRYRNSESAHFRPSNFDSRRPFTSSRNPTTRAGSLRAVVHSIDPQLQLTQIESMDRVVGEGQASRRFSAVLVSAFAAAAVLLAGLGYSVIGGYLHPPACARGIGHPPTAPLP
jgi:hypothetical protein